MKAIVIGAGVSGLATAGLLARSGVDVTVVEKLPEVGGRAGVETRDGFRWDTGPSWWLMPEAFDHFYALMGTSAAAELDLRPLTPALRLITDTFPTVDVTSGVENVTAVAEQLEPGSGARLRSYLDQAGYVYDVSLRKMLYTTFSSLRPFLDRETLTHLPLLGRLLTQSLHELVSSTVSHPVLTMLLEYPSVFLATSPTAAPSMYHLLSHADLVEGVVYPMGGFTLFVDSLRRLATAAGATIRTGTPVLDILTTGRPARATGVRITNEEGAIERIDADIVISTADLHHTETALLPPHLRTYRWQRRDPGISCALALLGVDGHLPQLKHHNLVLSDDWNPDFAAIHGADPTRAHSRSIYVSNTSVTDPTAAPAGATNIFMLIPTAADPELGYGSLYQAPTGQVEEIVSESITTLATRAEIPDLPARIRARYTIGPADFAGRYNSWQASALGLAHTLRQSALLRGSNRSRKVAGLYYAGGTTLPGIGLPLCLISAENILKRLIGDTSGGRLEELPQLG
ncbi:MAG: phytoene desaturase family protein [Corynebacterium sp.]|nr:phytoene desaturase family protein [Corynebacterium sp.]